MPDETKSTEDYVETEADVVAHVKDHILWINEQLRELAEKNVVVELTLQTEPTLGGIPRQSIKLGPCWKQLNPKLILTPTGR